MTAGRRPAARPGRGRPRRRPRATRSSSARSCACSPARASSTGRAAGAWARQIPQGVREVVGRRLDRLSAETNEALTVAAAIGREFDAELVWPGRGALAGGADDGGRRRRSPRGWSPSAAAGALLLRPRARPRDPLRGAQPGAALRACTSGSARRSRSCAGTTRTRASASSPTTSSRRRRAATSQKAIDYAERAGGAGDGASSPTRRRPSCYERALEVLELSEEPDEARRCRAAARARAAPRRAAAQLRRRARDAFEPGGRVGARARRHRRASSGRRSGSRC